MYLYADSSYVFRLLILRDRFVLSAHVEDPPLPARGPRVGSSRRMYLFMPLSMCVVVYDEYCKFMDGIVS